MATRADLVALVRLGPHAASFATKARHLEKGLLLPEGQVPQDWFVRPS